MIATHNIKVNGKWYKAGDEITELKRAPKNEPEAPANTMTEAEKQIAAEDVLETEEKPKTTRRRTPKQ